MLKRTIEIELKGEKESDIEDAFQEVSRLIKEGYLVGQNSNETGSFTFNIEDQE